MTNVGRPLILICITYGFLMHCYSMEKVCCEVSTYLDYIIKLIYWCYVVSIIIILRNRRDSWSVCQLFICYILLHCTMYCCVRIRLRDIGSNLKERRIEKVVGLNILDQIYYTCIRHCIALNYNVSICQQAQRVICCNILTVWPSKSNSP